MIYGVGVWSQEGGQKEFDRIHGKFCVRTCKGSLDVLQIGSRFGTGMGNKKGEIVVCDGE